MRKPGEVYEVPSSAGGTHLVCNAQCDQCGYVLPIVLGYAEAYPCIRCNAGGEPEADEEPFGPGHVEYCPERSDETHCDHWWDAEPCCACGSDEGDKGDDYGEG